MNFVPPQTAFTGTADPFAQARQYLARLLPWPNAGEAYVNICNTFQAGPPPDASHPSLSGAKFERRPLRVSRMPARSRGHWARKPATGSAGVTYPEGPESRAWVKTQSRGAPGGTC
jgi:hypothetical protein